MNYFLKRASERQRAAYRVRLERAKVRALLILGDVPIQVELLDISSGGFAVSAGLELWDGFEAQLAVGADVTVRFDADGRSLFARATVRSVVDEEVTRRMGFQFCEPERLWKQLDDRLWRLFNRREAFRAARTIGGGALRHLTTWWDGVERTDVLHDVSTTGLSLRVSTNDPVRFPPGEPIRCRFQLNERDAPFELVITLAHDSVARGSRRVGFAFDTVAGGLSEGDQERIMQHVLSHQRSTLRQRG